MHARAQDLLRFGDVGIGKLLEREGSLHYTPAHMRPALRTPRGSKPSRTRFVNAAIAGFCGSNTSAVAPAGAGRRIRVACPPADPTRARTAAAPASSAGGKAAHMSPPAQS